MGGFVEITDAQSQMLTHRGGASVAAEEDSKPCDFESGSMESGAELKKITFAYFILNEK